MHETDHVVSVVVSSQDMAITISSVKSSLRKMHAYIIWFCSIKPVTDLCWKWISECTSNAKFVSTNIFISQKGAFPYLSSNWRSQIFHMFLHQRFPILNKYPLYCALATLIDNWKFCVCCEFVHVSFISSALCITFSYLTANVNLSTPAMFNDLWSTWDDNSHFVFSYGIICCIVQQSICTIYFFDLLFPHEKSIFSTWWKFDRISPIPIYAAHLPAIIAGPTWLYNNIHLNLE